MYQRKSRRYGAAMVALSLCLRLGIFLGLDAKAAAMLSQAARQEEFAAWMLYLETGKRAAPEEETAITPEEGAAILEAQLGTVDAATGNAMSYGYEGTLTLDGVDYYNYRVSWLVNGDHLSYLTNYLVSTDGLVVQEYLPETG